MADEEKKNEETTEEAAEETPEETPEEAPKEETPKDDSSESPDEDSASPPPEPEAGGSAGEAEQPPDGDGEAEQPTAKAPAGAGADDEELSWKAQRRLERSRQPAEAKPPRSPEDRAAERTAKQAAAKAERSRYRKRARTKGEKGTGTPPAERAGVDRKIRQGRVVSNKADKTITVRIDVARRHATYEKVVRRSGTLHAHDERNEATEGDLVQVVETRPLSRTKRWRLTEILEKAK
jgi:small subunit ribosomal protein S17